MKNRKSNISNSIKYLLKISNARYTVKTDFIKENINITDRKDKYEFINYIKQDLNNMYYNLSLLDLEILSNNIYYFACLIANNVSEKEIMNFASYNSVSYNNNEITNIKLSKINFDIKLKQINYLVNKYIEKIKNT